MKTRLSLSNEAGRRQALKRFGYAEAPPADDAIDLEHEWRLLAPGIDPALADVPLNRLEPAKQALAIALDAPMAMITVIEETDVWFLTGFGMPTRNGPRDLSICGHTILQRTPLIINDALDDPRFCDNPLVIQEPHIRFYAGVPIRTRTGLALGLYYGGTGLGIIASALLLPLALSFCAS